LLRLVGPRGVEGSGADFGAEDDGEVFFVVHVVLVEV